jgi:glycine hydroxymethyltransferase
MHQIAGKAVCFKEAQRKEFKEYAKQIKKNTEALAEGLKSEGLELVSGGTDNHLVLVDLKEHRLNGRQAEKALENVNIIVNKNAVPQDPEPPKITSGIRIGTPALTTREMKEEELEEIGELIGLTLENPEDQRMLAEIRKRVEELMEEFPLYRNSDVEF